MATATIHLAGEDQTLNSHAGRRLKFVTGTFDYDATAGAAACISLSGIGLGQIKFISIPPSNGFVFKCTVSGTVTAYYVGAVGSVTTAAAFTAVPTGTSMATCSGLVFFATGYE